MCARDPLNPAHCLKFELPGAERTRAGLRARLRRWLGRRFPSRGDNAVELRAWQRLQRDTRWGRALRCDCVTLEDGTPAPSLYKCIFGEPLPCGSLQEAVSEFEAFLVARGIPLFDLNAGNFVVVPAGDGVRLVCVDAKSTVAGKEIVPVSRWIPWLRRRKVRRRAERLRQRIRTAL